MRQLRSGLVVVAIAAATACSQGNSENARASGARASEALPATTSPSEARASEALPATTSPSEARVSEAMPAPSTLSEASAIPPVPPRAAEVGLVDIRSVVADAVVDLRYATADNFTGSRLYPIGARCFVHRTMAPGLRVAAARLRQLGNVLVFWDCYRPHWAQVRMFEIVPNPNWVARPGPLATSHEAGRSVDVTLARKPVGTACLPSRRVQGHCLLRMGTKFDNFTPRAYAYATVGVSAQAQANRARLRHAMARGGLEIYVGEWWHFDGPGADVGRPHLRAPLK